MNKATNRFSCKCKLCKAKWTTEITDRLAAYNAHEVNCPRFTEVLAGRLAAWKQSEDSERYQMACAFFTHLPIKGHYNADIKCDGRCMSATGHNCECSCGGKNHGIGAAA